MNHGIKFAVYVVAGFLFGMLARSWWHAVDDYNTQNGWKQCIGCASTQRATITWTRTSDGKWVCSGVSGDPDAARRAAKECQP